MLKNHCMCFMHCSPWKRLWPHSGAGTLTSAKYRETPGSTELVQFPVVTWEWVKVVILLLLRAIFTG
jgi:hypothetical protein